MDGGVFETTRDPRRTAVRAAAISATELIVQRAALELDVAPEEFDVLAPYPAEVAEGERRPFLQVADALANGSSFCRHLLSGATLPIEALIDSMLDDPKKWPRERTEQGDHRTRCSTSCYRCMQRFNNRNYHGLLDWRLGLSFLRAMRDPGFVCGLDGDWASTYELSDWPEIADRCVARVGTLVPGCETGRLGSLALPGFTLDAARSRWAVIVHPLWKRDSLDTSLGLSPDITLIDTFEFGRRPLQALERARRE